MNLLITRLPQALTVWEFAYRIALPLRRVSANEQEADYRVIKRLISELWRDYFLLGLPVSSMMH